VIGVTRLIDDMLRERGMQPRYMNGYRLTDRETMKVVIEAAGQARTHCEQSLSKVSHCQGTLIVMHSVCFE
jgi:amino-acid N-acetyltransferase